MNASNLLRVCSRLRRMSVLAIAFMLLVVGMVAIPGPALAASDTGPTTLDRAQVVTPMATAPKHCVDVGFQCTNLTATRSGSTVTTSVWGTNYGYQVLVWRQLNVYEASTMTLIYSDLSPTFAARNGTTPKMTRFIDCGFTVFIQAWTWQGGSNQQPETDIVI